MPTEEEVSKEICLKFGEIVEKTCKGYGFDSHKAGVILGLTLGPLLSTGVCSLIKSYEDRIKIFNAICKSSKEAIENISKLEMN